MKRTMGVWVAATLVLQACGDAGADDAPEPQGDCLATDARVGHRAVLAGRAHGVAGTVEVVDDCTLVVRGFTYDGGGLNVRFYGAPGNTPFEDGTALTGNLLGTRRTGQDFTIKLPVGVGLSSVERISVWCVTADEDFGSGTFGPP